MRAKHEAKIRCNWQIIDPHIGDLLYLARTIKSFAHDLINHSMRSVIDPAFLPTAGVLLWGMDKKESILAEAWLQRHTVPICNPMLGRGKWTWREPDAAVPLSDFDALPVATGVYAWVVSPAVPRATWISDLLFDPSNIESRKKHRNSLVWDVVVAKDSSPSKTSAFIEPAPPPKPMEAFHRYTVWAKQGNETGAEIAEALRKIIVGPDILNIAENTVVLLLTDKAAATVKRLWPWWGTEMDKEFSPVTKEAKTIVTATITELWRSIDERRPKVTVLGTARATIAQDQPAPSRPIVTEPVAQSKHQPTSPTTTDWESAWKE